MNIQFQLIKIDAPQFAVIKDSEFSNPLHVNFEANFAVDNNVTSIKNTLKVVYSDSSVPVMQLVVECIYAVSSESWSEMKKPDVHYVIPVGFLRHICTITIGTTRGILYEKTAATNLNKYVMPLVNVVDMVKEDMVFAPSKSV